MHGESNPDRTPMPDNLDRLNKTQPDASPEALAAEMLWQNAQALAHAHGVDSAEAARRAQSRLPSGQDQAAGDSREDPDRAPFEVFAVVLSDDQFLPTVKAGVPRHQVRGYISHAPGEADWLSPPAVRRPA